MKHTFRQLIILAALLTALTAAAWERTPHGVKATVGDTDITLSVYTPRSIRVVKTPAGQTLTEESLSVTAMPADIDFRVTERGGSLALVTSDVKASLNLTTGEVSYATPKGRPLLREKGAAGFEPVDDAGRPALAVSQAFTLDKDEAVYGLGNLENGRLSQRGVTRTLMPGNVEDGIPVLQSVKGYGILWDNYSPTLFADSPGETRFRSEVGEGVDYYFMYGGDADGVVSQIRALSGRVPMFPLWTYGFWQSRERYKTQKEIVDVVRRHRELGIPLDGIIQDWQYWGNNYLWNAMEFESPDFPDPQAMIDTIHGRNAKVIVSIWSSFGPQTKPYRELDAKGLLFNFSTWPQSGLSHVWPPRMDYPSGVRVYDAYSPEARDIYWRHLKRLHDLKIDGWWMDSTEPDHLDVKPEDFDTPTAMGSFRKVRNAYPLMTVGGVYTHQREVDSTKRVFILTRSGYTGQQRYGANVWTGDVTSTWQNLRCQVPAALNFTLTGIPHVNSDIGGFFCGHYNKAWGDNSAPRNPLYQELYVRWMQMGLFSPMMRSHGADAYREIYQFGSEGEPVYDAIAQAIRLRYRLLPYIYSTAWDVTARDGSFMRALVMDFPADRATHDRADQLMFGRQLMVAPILEAMYTPEVSSDKDENSGWNRDGATADSATFASIDFTAPRQAEVYLPAGVKWYDFFTGKRHDGGRTIMKDADIFTIPLYVRAGSILPLGPDGVNYATEKPWDELEVIVYPGADGAFTLYEDEGDNYNYEKGEYSTIHFKWDDRRRILTILPREGSFPGMIEKRTFIVSAADRSAAPVAVSYDGSQTSVKL